MTIYSVEKLEEMRIKKRITKKQLSKVIGRSSTYYGTRIVEGYKYSLRQNEIEYLHRYLKKVEASSDPGFKMPRKQFQSYSHPKDTEYVSHIRTALNELEAPHIREVARSFEIRHGEIREFDVGFIFTVNQEDLLRYEAEHVMQEIKDDVQGFFKNISIELEVVTPHGIEYVNMNESEPVPKPEQHEAIEEGVERIVKSPEFKIGEIIIVQGYKSGVYEQKTIAEATIKEWSNWSYMTSDEAYYYGDEVVANLTTGEWFQ